MWVAREDPAGALDAYTGSLDIAERLGAAGPRPLVRSLLLREEHGDNDAVITEIPSPSL